MAKIEMLGVEEYSKKLAALEKRVRDEVIGEAVYEGANIVADSVRAQLSALPTDSGFGAPMQPLAGINRIQKAALISSFGVTKMRDDDGFINVKLGFDGYNPIRTKRWPKGQPNAMIARSIERGTTWLRRTPFMKKALQSAQKRAEGVMGAIVDKKIYAIMKK